MVKVASPMAAATCIAAYEVTRGQYLQWLNSVTDPPPNVPPCTWKTDHVPQLASWPPATEELDLPVAGVDWCDAQAYCLARNRRLCGRITPVGTAVPTSSFADYYESEWYNACTERGAHTYPYGNAYEAFTCNGNDAGYGEPWTVGYGGACQTWNGVYDLSGNVWEWENSCSGSSGETDNCRVRGGAWNGAEALMHCAADLLQQRQARSPALGIRCCADPIYPD
jgi:formylglycine-generating enzyme required for sulfatase activity